MARSALDSLRSLVTLFFSIMGENYMAQMIPKQISSDTKSAAERRFFNFIRDAEGTEDWIVLHSVNIGRHISQTQGEALLHPLFHQFFLTFLVPVRPPARRRSWR